MRPVLTQAQATIQRGLKEAYLIDGAGELMTRGERSYLFDFEQPTPRRSSARGRGNGPDTGLVQQRIPRAGASGRLCRPLPLCFAHRGRVDPVSAGRHAETVALYHQLESERGRLLFEFGCCISALR